MLGLCDSHPTSLGKEGGEEWNEGVGGKISPPVCTVFSGSSETRRLEGECDSVSRADDETSVVSLDCANHQDT